MDERTFQLTCFDSSSRKKVFGPIDVGGTEYLATISDASMIAAPGPAGAVKLISGIDGRQIALLKTVGEDVDYVAFTRDGNYLATCSQQIKFWDLETFNEVIELETGLAPKFHLAFSPAGDYMLSAALDGSLRQWKAPFFKDRQH